MVCDPVGVWNMFSNNMLKIRVWIWIAIEIWTESELKSAWIAILSHFNC